MSVSASPASGNAERLWAESGLDVRIRDGRSDDRVLDHPDVDYPSHPAVGHPNTALSPYTYPVPSPSLHPFPYLYL